MKAIEYNTNGNVSKLYCSITDYLDSVITGYSVNQINNMREPNLLSIYSNEIRNNPPIQDVITVSDRHYITIDNTTKLLDIHSGEIGLIGHIIISRDCDIVKIDIYEWNWIKDMSRYAGMQQCLRERFIGTHLNHISFDDSIKVDKPKIVGTHKPHPGFKYKF